MSIATSLDQADRNQAYLRSARNLTLGLLWGGVALLVLATWLPKQFEDFSVFTKDLPIWLLGLLCEGLAAWLIVLRTRTSIESFADSFAPKRKLLGILLIAGGIALTIYYIALFVMLGLAGLGAVHGLLFLGLIGIVSGLVLMQPVPLPILQSIRQSDNMRILVMVLGPTIGILLFLATIVMTIIWRSDVFGGVASWQGANGWHFWLCVYGLTFSLGWLFFSLILVQADVHESAGMRVAIYGYNVVVTGFILLSVLAIWNVIIYAAFPLTFEWSKTRGLASLSPSTKNLIASLKEDTTVYVMLSQRSQDFADTQLLLNNAMAYSDKLHVVYVEPDTDYLTYEDLATRFPDIVPDPRSFRSDPDMSRGILLVYGYAPDNLPKDPRAKVPHSFIPKRRIVDVAEGPMPGSGSRSFLYKGEDELMKEINFFAEGQKKRIVYFLQGDDELEMDQDVRLVRNDMRADMHSLGCKSLVDLLKKENIECHGLSFGRAEKENKNPDLIYASETGPDKRKDVPRDAWAVIALGPSKTMAKETLDALERYMDGGGKMLASFDIVVNSNFKGQLTSGLENLMKKYGVQVGEEFLMRPVESKGDDPRIVIAVAPEETGNELAKQFLHLPYPLKTTRLVRPDPEPGRFKVDVLLQVDPRLEVGDSWLEKNVMALEQPIAWQVDMSRNNELLARLSKEAVPVAVTVSEGTKPRMVVFGDTEFLSNAYIEGKQNSFENYSLFISSLDWMSERASLGLRPKESSNYVLPTTTPIGRLLWLPAWLMVISLLGLGVGVWISRRR